MKNKISRADLFNLAKVEHGRTPEPEPEPEPELEPEETVKFRCTVCGQLFPSDTMVAVGLVIFCEEHYLAVLEAWDRSVLSYDEFEDACETGTILQ